jgi:hypothetical protein
MTEEKLEGMDLDEQQKTEQGESPVRLPVSLPRVQSRLPLIVRSPLLSLPEAIVFKRVSSGQRKTRNPSDKDPILSSLCDSDVIKARPDLLRILDPSVLPETVLLARSALLGPQHLTC